MNSRPSGRWSGFRSAGMIAIEVGDSELRHLKSCVKVAVNFMITERRILQVCAICALLLFHALTSCAQIVTQIAAGAYHSLFLKSDGSLWAMGDDEYGQL